VILLSDGYLANAAEPWLIPDLDALEDWPARKRTDAEDFQPFERDPETLARPWAVPGTPGLMHRIGGIEKDESGHISYDPANHQSMTDIRAAKIANIAHDIPEQDVSLGDQTGALAVVGWGSTFGPINKAVEQARERGHAVSHIHLRYINPFPANLESLLGGFEKVLVPEMNNGQLVTMLRSRYLIPAEGLNKVTGQPFKIADVATAIDATLE
jgi:2-oxoglutarate ferredoxin oxidoreductase subunit alpha